MLYNIYETQRSLMEPFADFAQTASKLYSNPVSPFSQTVFAQRMSAGYDLLYRLGKDYEKPVFGIHTVSVEGTDVAIHERVEIDKPFCELRRFKRFSDDPATLTHIKQQPAVLIVAPLSGHYATLLRDTVRTMLQGHKVYITDWKNARLVPLADGAFHLDDYVNYVQEFIRHLQSRYGNCHVVSVCQPTVPVLAAVSLMASRGETTPLSMTMMGGPIDARKSPTAVNNLATNRSYEWFENNVIYRVPDSFPGAGRRVYPGFLQHTGFVAMNPDRHATSHYDYFKDLIKGDDASAEAHRKFYDEYNAVLDMDADYYLETIKTVFQDYSLVHGTWDVRAPEGQPERVRPQDIHTTALLTVEGELDDISGSGQTEAAHSLCTGIAQKNRSHYEVKGAGHYGIFSGRRWRELVYPQVRDFILAHEPAHAADTGTTPLPSDDAPRRRTGAAAAVHADTAGLKAAATAAASAPRAKRAPPQGLTPAADAVRALAARIDAVLPQTQCTRCGYPDCAAYALAVATAEAGINQCPPGGAEGVERLAALTQRPARPLSPEHGTEGPRAVAFIDEAWCIGCTLCLKACPTDAILGANKQMHTVIEEHCTGCELCIPVCPVDCIVLENASGSATGWAAWSAAQAGHARDRYAARTQRLARDAQAAPALLPTPEPATASADAGAASSLAPPGDAKQAAIAAAMARARARRSAG